MDLAFLVQVVEAEQKLLTDDGDVRFVKWSGFKLMMLCNEQGAAVQGNYQIQT